MSASSGQKLTFEGEELDYNTDRDIQYCIRGSDKKSSINSFSDPQLGLNGRLLHNISKAGLKKPTPVQRHGMPQLVAGLDVMCCSHTGSGKTAAYLLPIINSIVGDASASRSADKGSGSSSGKENTSGTNPTGLILTPTRELAMQISKDANMFGEGLPVSSFAVFGGQLLRYELGKLKEGGVDILVATPGRLLHLLSEFDVLALGKIKYFVVDEADEMFDRGFFSAIRNIVDQFLIPKEERINALFSATFPNQIQYFAKKQLRSGFIFVVIGILGGASPDICQEIVCASRAEKKIKLEKIVQDLEATEKKLLVFCNTIEKTVEIFNFLHQSDYKVSGIHSDLTQGERTQALKDFDYGQSTILIATSVAARGLNIRGIDLVLNYDLPKDINEYIQRIGRTGRVGVVGESISFFDKDTDEDLAKDLVDALTSGNQSVPTFLSEFCSGADDEEFGSSEEALLFGMKKLKVKRCFEHFEEEDAF